MAAADALLTDNDRKEALSRAYVCAVAGFAGYTVSVEDFDRDGIDLRVHAGGRLSPTIGLQLKATERLGDTLRDGNYRYNDLPARNYERLIRPSQVPRYLVLLALPSDESDWLAVSVDRLLMQRCAYWVSLSGAAETDNRATVTVSIPPGNLFDPNALQQMLEWSRGGYDGNAAL